MKNIIACVCVLLSTGAIAQQATDSIEAANARCEAARVGKLEPIRQRKIAQCEKSANRPTAGCETYYSTYGNNSANVNGSVVRGRFYDLPACVAARRVVRNQSQKQNF